MKVQAKLLSDHYQYEVVEESSNYYIVYGTGGKVAVSKADYEPVQEWVDVTGRYSGITVNVPGLEDCEFKLETTANGYRLFERREQ